MTQGQAVLLTLAFLLAVSTVISVLVFLAALRYEYLDRKQARARRHDEAAARDVLRPRTGEVEAAPVDCPVFPLAMARSRRDQGVRRSNGRWSA